MKKIFLLLALSTLVTAIFFSCKKETSCEGCKGNNNPPIAIAGPDQVITLPTDSISLDGSASNDPDGTISEWIWKKIEGPASFQIISSATARTVAKNLVVGVYQFELKVTDDKGLTAKDTMQVIVDAVVTTNHAPVANAGPDQTITLPVHSVNLDGSASTDPENNITTYVWTKISGPSSFSITNQNTVQTQVTNLVQGIYQFELKVTDAGALFSKDTMLVIVSSLPPCNNTNWPTVSTTITSIGALAEPRNPIAGAAGNKVVFAGGWKFYNTYPFGCDEAQVGSSVVDIYDVNSHSWSATQLSKARLSIGSVSSSNKIFFAGGFSWTIFPTYSYFESYDNVDIYNVATNTWELAHLSKAREGVATATIGNKVFFAGGGFYNEPPFTTGYWDYSNVVDIYDLSTNHWSVTTLSVKRSQINTVVINDKIYFIGGWGPFPNYMTVVDIYNNSTNTWTTSDLQTVAASLLPPAGLGMIKYLDVAGDNIIFWDDQHQVGIRNLTSGSTTVACLDHRTPVFLINNNIVFYDSWGSRFSIYNPGTGIWSKGVSTPNIPANIFHEGGIVSLNNTIYLGGGYSDYCQYYNNVYSLSW